MWYANFSFGMIHVAKCVVCTSNKSLTPCALHLTVYGLTTSRRIMCWNSFSCTDLTWFDISLQRCSSKWKLITAVKKGLYIIRIKLISQSKDQWESSVMVYHTITTPDCTMWRSTVTEQYETIWNNRMWIYTKQKVWCVHCDIVCQYVMERYDTSMMQLDMRQYDTICNNSRT